MPKTTSSVIVHKELLVAQWKERIQQYFPTDMKLLENLLGTTIPTDPKGTPLVTVKTARQQIANYTLQIYQIGVACCRADGSVPKKRNYGISDDTTYQNYPELVKLVPRCYSVVEVTTPLGETYSYRLTGLPKFGGELNIDDDDLADSARVEEGDTRSDTTDYDSVVVTEKSNGKSVGFRVILLDGQAWLYGGSKNRHRLVRYQHFQEDIQTLQDGDQLLVIPILQSCYRQLQDLSEANRLVLFQRLSSTEAPYTLCGEYNDGKHMVPIPEGQTPEVEWFALQQCGHNHHQRQSLSTDILRNLQWMQSLGLITIDFHSLTREQFMQEQTEAREGRNSEGYVYHYIKHSPEGTDPKTVSIVKHKLTWYILIRVARQIIKNAKTTQRLQVIYRSKLKQTLLQRNSFLHLPIGMLGVWYELLCGFVEWMLEQGHEPSEVGFDTHQRGMGNLWRDFITNNPTFNDDFLKPEEEVSKRGLQAVTEVQAFPQSERLLIIVQGIPGLGKTEVGNLASNSLGDKSVTLEQDTFWKYKSKAKSKCLEQMESYLCDTKLQYIWLLRNNANHNQYRDFIRLAKDFGWKVLIMMPRELAYPNSAGGILLKVCHEAVIERVGHVSFDAVSPQKRHNIVDSFYRTFRPATIAESQADSVCAINWLRPDCCSREVTLQVEHRLSRDDVAGQMILDAQHFRLQTPEPLYIAVKFPEDSKEFLTTKIGELVPDLCLEGKRVYLDHLTLAHSEQLIGNEELWGQLKARRGQTVKVCVSSLVIVDDVQGHPESVVVVAHPVDIEDDSDLSGLVLSGVPHITAVLPKGTAPKHSIDILQGKDASRLFPLEGLEFIGGIVCV